MFKRLQQKPSQFRDLVVNSKSNASFQSFTSPTKDFVPKQRTSGISHVFNTKIQKEAGKNNQFSQMIRNLSKEKSNSGIFNMLHKSSRNHSHNEREGKDNQWEK